MFYHNDEVHICINNSFENEAYGEIQANPSLQRVVDENSEESHDQVVLELDGADLVRAAAGGQRDEGVQANSSGTSIGVESGEAFSTVQVSAEKSIDEESNSDKNSSEKSPNFIDKKK